MAENIEVVKMYCQPSEALDLVTVCLMGHLILVFNTFHYIKLKGLTHLSIRFELR